MPKLPMMSARKFDAFLRKQGFSAIRQVGSHRFFKHVDGKTTVVPMHARKDIGRGLLRSILRDIKLSPSDFLRLFKKG